MNVEVTDACNVHCSSCMSPHGNNFMSVDDFVTILSKIPRNEKKRIALHWRGESCLHPKLPEIAYICKRDGVKAWVSTNTSIPLLGDEKYVEKLLSSLNHIEVCVDGYNQETLSKYRVGSNWNMVFNNVKVIGSVKTKCRRYMRVLMFRYNENHQRFFRKLARRNNFDRICFANPIINYKMKMDDREAQEWLALNRRFHRYRKEGNWWILKKSKTCIPHICVSVHGSVHPCGHDWKLEYDLGNLLTGNWKTVRENHTKLRPEMMKQMLSICGKWCCLTDEKVVSWKNL